MIRFLQFGQSFGRFGSHLPHIYSNKYIGVKPYNSCVAKSERIKALSFTTKSDSSNKDNSPWTDQVQEKLIYDKFSKYKAAIFDKDGTLLCFHSMWAPWSMALIKKLCDASGLNIAPQLYKALGVCSDTLKIGPGLLAEGTKDQIKVSLTETMVSEGLSLEKANELVDAHLIGANPSNELIFELHDLHHMFTVLRQHGIRTAICTSDNRDSTVKSLKIIGVLHLVDKIVCGDDVTGVPKPAPDNARAICAEFGVEPHETVMVGDTVTDMSFGKNSQMGATIGVLSGIGSRRELETSGATAIVDSVEDVLPLLLPDRTISLTPAAEGICNQPWELIIMDKDGTLSDIHHKWLEWALNVGGRLTQETNPLITELFYDAIGFCGTSTRIKSGLLAEGTTRELKECLASILLVQGNTPGEVEDLMQKVWVDAAMFGDRALDNVRTTIEELRTRGLKIAVNTMDARRSTMDFLKRIKCSHLVDCVMTADDTHNWKPKPNTIFDICSKLGVEPKYVMNVGDARNDMLCGRAAGVGANVAVLSGIVTPQLVLPHADVLIPNITYLPDLARLPRGTPRADQWSRGQTTSGSATPSPSSRSGPNASKILGQSIFGVWNGQPTAFYSTKSAPRSTTGDQESYDYVIVGAGSAGCVLANRLTASPGAPSVLLLESGPKDYTWKIHMPAALMYNLCDDKYNWFYHTVPQRHMNDRVMYWPRGRVWGGSSSLNAMVYIRGHADDYDRWERQGASGWNYANCLPYFKKAQSHELGGDTYRGGSGPLHVTRGKTKHPLHAAFIQAGGEAGYPITSDMNGFQQEGFGEMDMTIHKGRRWSAAMAYLRPALKRSNLTAKTKSLISRVIIDEGRAIGVEYFEGNQSKKIFANREVILSCGSINSPQLLMLSGIGDADHLSSLGIPTSCHLPGVGNNLQDHLELYVQQECTQPITLFKAQWKYPHVMIGIGLRWFLTQTGWGATTHLESGGFIRTEAGVAHPDLQFHFLPSTVNDHGRQMGPCHAYQVHVGPMRSESRGRIWLQSTDPRLHPLMDANYLSTERDRWEFRTAIRLSREVFAQPAFDAYRGRELLPGSDVVTDSQLDAHVRRYADSAYHPSCTCKMGADSDPMTVLDAECRVRGVQNLRVVDASAMPSVVSGNLNGPTIMLAERAADLILGQTLLPSEPAPVWRPQHPDRQRDGNPLVKL